MPIYALGSQEPTIDTTAFIHPDAVIIGSVFIRPQSSVCSSVVVRGNAGEVRISARTSIQDGTVVHTTLEWPTTVGNDCLIGHLAHLEACIIEDSAQVSSGAIVLHRARICSGAIVGANSVVLNDTLVPANALAVGSPAIIKENRARSQDIVFGANNYVQRTERFRRELRRID